MSVRRQLDNQHGSISLIQLLYEFEARPKVSLALKTSDVTTDRLAFERYCEGALIYAQRQLAHRVPWDDGIVSLGQLDAALDSIDHIVRKYYAAITCQVLQR